MGNPNYEPIDLSKCPVIKVQSKPKDEVWALAFIITDLEDAHHKLGREPQARPGFAVNAWDEASVEQADATTLRDVIPALEAHAATLRVGLRLAQPLAGVSGSTPKVTAGQMEISRLKAIFAVTRPGSATHRVMSAKLSKLGVTVDAGSAPAAPAAKKPTLTERCLAAKGLPLTTKVQSRTGGGGGVVEGSELADD
jgi:hypothetical protein